MQKLELYRFIRLLRLRIYKDKLMHTDIEDTDYLFDATTEKEENIIIIENPALDLRLAMYFIRKAPFKNMKPETFLAMQLAIKHILRYCFFSGFCFIIFFTTCFVLKYPFIGKGLLILCIFLFMFLILMTSAFFMNLKKLLKEFEEFQ